MTAPPTTTRQSLRRFRNALLALTVVTAWFAMAAFNRAQDTANTVNTSTAPGIVAVSAARGALIEADRAAITSFSTGAAHLTGPGDDYRGQIAIASQNLTQAAQDIGDDGDSATLELVDGLLVSYTSSIEQAAASFRQSERTAPWASDLWTASRLLHAEHGVLALLDRLRDQQIDTLDDQVDSGTALEWLLWAAPGTGLLVVLLATQVSLRRRFRRTLNAGLVAATLFVLGLGVVAALTLVTGSRLDATRDTVRELSNSWRQQADARDNGGQRVLADLIDTQCAAEAGECGSTVQRIVLDIRHTSHPDSSQAKPTDGSARIVDHAATASGNDGYAFLIPLTAALAAVAIAAGLYVRMDEYRYRSR
ncbi:hypothetical protein [Alloactinosynnema sp. L-07]|uniref:hypothetical protein n=1 Tax=Alloactinosynnema sp. L-07 TaxID=1653480 RepID=UPI0008306CD7|nr:hypothetical protein [Alloactinosynnema sp. L-07]